MEPEVHRRAVKRERAREEKVETGICCASGRGLPAEERSEVEDRTGDEHRQPGDEVDVRVGDRVDPLAGVAGAIQPVRVRRLDLDHSLHGADSQAGGACCDELPEVAARLRNPYEPGLEDGQEDGRREAPVADPHHARSHADRRAIPVPHARLRGLVLPTVSDAKPDRDPVRDERDVEDEQTAGGEPEGALGEAFARKWPAHDPRQDVPAEAGGDQRPAADDHQVRVREVPDEVACVAGTREPLGCPGQVLEHHVQAAEDEEGSRRR